MRYGIVGRGVHYLADSLGIALLLRVVKKDSPERWGLLLAKQRFDPRITGRLP